MHYKCIVGVKMNPFTIYCFTFIVIVHPKFPSWINIVVYLKYKKAICCWREPSQRCLVKVSSRFLLLGLIFRECGRICETI